MDTITVVFTGMMIFDVAGQTVYPVDNQKHEFRVKTDLVKNKLVTSVEFKGLAKGDSQFNTFFPILKLGDLAGVEVQVDKSGLKTGIPVNFNGEFMGDGDHDVCRLGKAAWQTWTAVKWTVKIDADPTIVLNGDYKHPFKLAKDEVVYISNDNPGATYSHVAKYSMGVKDLGNKPVVVKECETPKFHNPITCPPVSLK